MFIEPSSITGVAPAERNVSFPAAVALLTERTINCLTRSINIWPRCGPDPEFEMNPNLKTTLTSVAFVLMLAVSGLAQGPAYSLRKVGPLKGNQVSGSKPNIVF